jgi:hypothetical protein
MELKKDGDFDVVSASDVPFDGGATPRALTIPEIDSYVEKYAQAAKNFVERAGGDGVESEVDVPYPIVVSFWNDTEATFVLSCSTRG